MLNVSKTVDYEPYLIRVLVLVVPSSVTRAPSHSQSHGHDGGRGLCTPGTYGRVQVRGRSLGAADQREGAVQDELGGAEARGRRQSRRGRDL